MSKRVPWVLLCALLVPLAATAQPIGEEWGMDYRGGDYTSTRTRDVWSCKQVCTRDSRCRAYTFRLDSNECFLKSVVNDPRRDPNAVSGTKGGGGHWPGDLGGITEDWGTDRRGGDYTTARADDVRDCKRTCSRDPRCRAYTFRLDTRECFLKNVVVPARPDDDTISGVKDNGGGNWGGGWGGAQFQEQRGFDRRGGDYSSFSTRSSEDCKRACGNDFHCRAFTFLFDERRCYLKDTMYPMVRNGNAVTGTKTRN